MTRSVPGPTVTSKVLALLGAFDAEHRRMSLSELARRAGLPLTTAHRLVGELVGWQALTRLPDGRYEVGRRLWEVGLLASLQVELRQAASPSMQDVYAATGENVHLAVREGLEALYVERISGERSVPVVAAAGARLPLHATGVGKVLLAYAPAEIVDAVLRRPRRVTRHTIVERGRLQRELEQVRARGFARTAEEMTLGTCSVAVPVFGPADAHADGDHAEVVAALGIVVTSVRRDLPKLVPVLQVASAGITRRLFPEPVSVSG
ncbi:MAG: IclR family transcriptional regulator [Kineosporiaceae bacterium]